MKRGAAEADRTVHAIRSKPTLRRKAKGIGPKGRGSDKGQTCGRCGKPHEPKKCPAWGKTCHKMKCHQKNHFSDCCQSKPVRELVQASEGSDSVSEAVRDYFVGELSIGSIDSAEWHSIVRCNNSRIKK